MRSKTLLITALIGATTAQLPTNPKRSPLESQTPQGTRGPDETALAQCSSAVSEIETLASAAPTPPADLASLRLPIDPCAPPSLTGKLQSDWSSYTSAALQWYLSHTAEFDDYFTACEGVSVFVEAPVVCSTDLAALTGVTATPAASTGATTGADATDGASGSASPSSTSTSSTPNAAPRETGFVVAAAAAAAAAGFMGAVAVL
ncbi:hypothetical protein F5Y09DRAFT_300880 [Xylaria sp. FL1042]|nr:hypothetical protein F5Y09DRAFT_300880 [Xylaria sp. FL1042]